MSRIIPLAAVWALMAAPAALAQRNAAPERPPARAGAREGSAVKPAPRLGNPGSVARQLMRMTPEERERALEKLPVQQQDRIRVQLQRFDSLPKAEQERQLRLGENFASLPPDKQDLVRRQIQAFNQLPDDRRRLVGAAFKRLRRMPDSERQARMGTEQFRNRFTPAEQQMLADLSENLPPPTAEPPRP